MFRYPKAANQVANIATPIYSNNKAFFTSAYGTGGGLLDLNAPNGEVVSKEVYFTQNMKNHHGSVGKGTVTYADGHLYIQSERNAFALAEATSSGYREKGRFDIPDKGLPSWAHPVISDGRLYVRNQDTLLAYDIKAGGR